jgi:hypothetical protein
MGEKKTISGNRQCRLMAALTEQQGLELSLLSPSLYGGKIKAINP